MENTQNTCWTCRWNVFVDPTSPFSSTKNDMELFSFDTTVPVLSSTTRDDPGTISDCQWAFSDGFLKASSCLDMWHDEKRAWNRLVVTLFWGDLVSMGMFTANREWLHIIYIHTFIHSYIPTYIHSYIPTYIHSYIPTYLPSYIPTYTYIPTYLRAYVPTYLHTYLPTSIHPYRQTHRHTHTHRCTYIQTYIRTYRQSDIHCLPYHNKKSLAYPILAQT